MRLANWILAAAALAWAWSGLAATAKTQFADDDVLMLADEVVYDDRSGIVTAVGSVELARGDRVLRADQIAYDKRRDLVTATDNVALVEPSGEVIFADRLELTGDLKSGAVHGLAMLLADGSRLAASGGRMSADGRTRLANAVYSPCNLCEDNPDKDPLWQVKALRVTHDRKQRSISYQDAFLEVFGVPVLYTPFFSHPDPTVERKTGFLPPNFSRNSTLGFTYGQPYFFNIAGDRDATITPIVTSKEGAILTGEYRQATENGYFEAASSITRGDRLPGDNRPSAHSRGHIDTYGEFALNPYWKAGFDIARSTDATYLARYGFARGQPSLIQNVYLHGGESRVRADLDAYYFQNLDPNIDEKTVPWVLPLFDYAWRSEAGPDGIWMFNGNMRVLGRPRGADSQRLSLTTGWQMPLVSSAGLLTKLRLSLRGDVYRVTELTNPVRPTGDSLDGITGRVVPQAEANMRWPWVRDGAESRQIVEPILQLIIGPNGGNPTEIPNEDSLSFEFDDANLFSANRYPGLDRIESGLRANSGIRMAHYGNSGAWSELLIGQTWRARDDDTFETGTGLADHFSDYVGRLTVAPARWLDVSLRFRVNNDNLSIQRNSLSASAGPEWLRGNLSYINLSHQPTSGVPSTVEQLNFSTAYRFQKFWRLTAHHQRALSSPGGSLASGVGLAYEDECITLTLQAHRSFTHQLDVPNSTSISVMVRLRNLG